MQVLKKAQTYLHGIVFNECVNSETRDTSRIVKIDPKKVTIVKICKYSR